MPTLTTPPKLLNSAQEPANGTIVTRVTNQFLVGADLVVGAAAVGRVVDGVIKNAAGSAAFVIPPTPTGYAVEIVLVLDEWKDGRPQTVPSYRTVSVPAGATVTWSALVDVLPVLPVGDYAVPTWASDLLVARDAAAASASAAETARAAAVVAKDAAVVAKNAAQAVGNTNDTIMQGVDGNAASAFRVQADARQSATIASAIGAKISTPAAFTPAWFAGTQVTLAEATGRWTQVGKLVTYQFYVRCSVANTAATWTLSLPVQGVAVGGIPGLGTVGVGTAGVYNSAQAVLDSSGRMKFLMPGSTNYLATAPAVNNEIFGVITYEVV